VKGGAVPGRLNQAKSTNPRPGGFCLTHPEKCGATHKDLPNVVQLEKHRPFINWLFIIEK
jgi:heme/copper-type cytochrome/quinol oxidase subunit 2